MTWKAQVHQQNGHVLGYAIQIPTCWILPLFMSALKVTKKLVHKKCNENTMRIPRVFLFLQELVRPPTAP